MEDTTNTKGTENLRHLVPSTIKVLREYRDRLEALVDELSRFHLPRRAKVLEARRRSMVHERGPVRQLLMRASQMLEHCRLDTWNELEIKLLLEDAETAYILLRGK